MSCSDLTTMSGYQASSSSNDHKTVDRKSAIHTCSLLFDGVDITCQIEVGGYPIPYWLYWMKVDLNNIWYWLKTKNKNLLLQFYSIIHWIYCNSFDDRCWIVKWVSVSWQWWAGTSLVVSAMATSWHEITHICYRSVWGDKAYTTCEISSGLMYILAAWKWMCTMHWFKYEHFCLFGCFSLTATDVHLWVSGHIQNIACWMRVSLPKIIFSMETVG